MNRSSSDGAASITCAEPRTAFSHRNSQIHATAFCRLPEKILRLRGLPEHGREEAIELALVLRVGLVNWSGVAIAQTSIGGTFRLDVWALPRPICRRIFAAIGAPGRSADYLTGVCRSWRRRPLPEQPKHRAQHSPPVSARISESGRRPEITRRRVRGRAPLCLPGSRADRAA